MRYFLLTGLLFAALFSFGQHTDKCASNLIFQKLYNADPARYDAIEARAQEFIKHQNTGKTKAEGKILTIPVVFHVVYNPLQEGANLSEEVLQSQIDVLNEDYRRLNADAGNTRDIFKSSASDIQVEFQLAKFDPQGNPTNGITRKASVQNFNVFTFEDFVKYDSLGGTNAWPADSYLNIWTCDMSLVATQYVIGYATFPGGDPKVDGVVLEWEFVGRNTGATGNMGRTATHEVGHWLGLRHIWGDGDCTASDFVDDTPKAAGSNTVCADVNSCDNEDPYWQGMNPPDMVENYMDYTEDACLNAFTFGQKQRMHGFLYTDTLRMALFNSKALGDASGISKLDRSSSFSISPNPGSSEITISAEENSSITLSHIGGAIIREIKLTNNKRIDISDLSSGTYIITITGKEGNIAHQRFIKN